MPCKRAAWIPQSQCNKDQTALQLLLVALAPAGGRRRARNARAQKSNIGVLIFLYENTRNGSCFFILVSTGGFKHSCWFVLQIPFEFSATPVCVEVQKAGGFELFRTEQTNSPLTHPSLLTGLCSFQHTWKTKIFHCDMDAAVV